MRAVLPRALHPAYARALLARGALGWLVGRSLLAAGSRSLALSPLPALVLVGIVAGLVYLEARRAGEPTFHADLGLAPRWIPLLALLGAGSSEIGARLLLAAAGIA